MGSIRSLKRQVKVQERIAAAVQNERQEHLSEQEYLEWLDDPERYYREHFARYYSKSWYRRDELPDCYGIVGDYDRECCRLCPWERTCGDLRCQRMDEGGRYGRRNARRSSMAAGIRGLAEGSKRRREKLKSMMRPMIAS